MGAVASAMGSSVLSSDNVLQNIQALEATSSGGQLNASWFVTGLQLALNLAESVQGETITEESVKSFQKTLLNLRPSLNNPAPNNTALGQMWRLSSKIAHLVTQSFLQGRVTGENALEVFSCRYSI